MLDIDFDDDIIKKAVKEIYNSSKVKFIGPTAISKILHLFNLEVFVMWDEGIANLKIYEVAINADGYLEFLKKVKRELREAIKEGAERESCSEKEIIEKICKELPSDLLPRLRGFHRKLERLRSMREGLAPFRLATAAPAMSI